MAAHTLRELSAHLMHTMFDGAGEYVGGRHVEHVAEADGVRFLCPKCFDANGGAVGTHTVICWDFTVPDYIPPVPGRWRLEGNTIDDLSIMEAPGKTRSVLLLSGCAWHGFVTNGTAE